MKNKYEASHLGRIGNAVSQLGHAIARGASDVSISGKARYMADVKKSKYWGFLRVLIDRAFLYVDGEDHTKTAYLTDIDESYEIGIGTYQNIVCSFFIFVVCPIVVCISYPLELTKETVNYFKNGGAK